MSVKEKAPYLAKKDINELNIIKCPGCKGIHFRHAGNVLTFRKFDYHGKKHTGEIDSESHLVYVCISCGKAWIFVDGEIFDGSEHIDVAKFDKVNKALQEETGTDPHC